MGATLPFFANIIVLKCLEKGIDDDAPSNGSQRWRVIEMQFEKQVLALATRETLLEPKLSSLEMASP